MSTIQSLKNFIRHGKQARAVSPHADPIPNNQIVVPAVNSNQQKQQQHQQHDHRDVVDSKSTASHHHQKSVDSKSKRREADIHQIVAEERQSRSRMPKYPGLDRWVLVEKMGDGAFSNVYRAKDTSGEYDQVAIKVVRKYEMNSTQVCLARDLLSCPN